MRRRSVGNDPLGARERERGTPAKNFEIDLEKAVPAEKATRTASTEAPRE